MKDIILRINNSDGVEFTTVGKLYFRGDHSLIQYEETELSGFEGCYTTLNISPTRIVMKRHGQNKQDDTVMIFEKDRRVTGIYATPYGNVNMEILTNNISGIELPAEERRDIVITYSISLKGLLDARQTLSIKIFDKESNPTEDDFLKDVKKEKFTGDFNVEKMLAKISRDLSELTELAESKEVSSNVQ